MRTSGLIVTLAALFVLIPAVPGLAPAQPVESLASPHCEAIGSPRLLFYGDDPANLDNCQRDCRGGPGWLGGDAGYSGSYYAYAQCIADCNTAFWKDFDRKSRDMERDR